MLRLADTIDQLSGRIGHIADVALLVLLLVDLGVLVLRHVFGIGFIALQESATYAFAAAVVLAISRALRDDGHVRVDILSGHLSPRTHAAIDLAGGLLLLIPFALTLLWFALPYAARSWMIVEHSREASGLPLVFVLKSLLPLFASLLALAGFSRILRAIDTLRRIASQ